VKFVLILLTCISFIHAATKIMPLGDSITYDDTYADHENPRPAGKRGGYRQWLWYMLEDAQVPVDFVGSRQAGQDIVPPIDPDNDGYPGYTSYQIADMAYNLMSISDPDVVLLHIGTNDRTTTNPQGALDILNEIDRYEINTKHHIKVFVALIIQRREYDGRIAIWNRRLKEKLLQRQAAGDDIVIVDMANAGLTSDDYADNTHPNTHGYSKMAIVWYDALINNPYDPATPSYIPLEIYPKIIVPETNIIESNLNGNTITFKATIPEMGIEFK